MITFGIIIFSLFIHTSSSSYVGDLCVINDGFQRQWGMCTPNTDCPKVIERMRFHKIIPTTCGFQGSDPIVCCPYDLSAPYTGRISYIKCQEYTRNKIRQHAIYGGNYVRTSNIEHMAAIGWPLADRTGYGWDCGGSLISENFVLTAAHCHISRNLSYTSVIPTMVRLGAINIKEIAYGVQDIGIALIYLHSEYSTLSMYHDIALFKLEKSAFLTVSVYPICLWQSTTFESDAVPFATGWGKTSKLKSSDKLQEVSLHFIDHNVCVNLFGRTMRLNRGVIPEQLCVGDLRGGKDTCQGDSGGPLQVRYYDKIHSPYNDDYLVGITSFGKGCGYENTPAIYTRVSSYIDWIESVVWPYDYRWF